MTASNLPDPADERPAPTHHNGSDTEHEAADLMTPKAGTLRERALNAIASAGDAGLTDHELSETTNVYLYSIAPRRGELLRLGWVEDSGTRRLTPGGVHAIVWTLTVRARAQLADRVNA